MKRNARNVSGVDYEGFVELFIQLANYIYAKPKCDLSHLSPLALLYQLMNTFREAAKQKSDRNSIFNKPEGSSLGDNYVLEELNKMLESNPDFHPPEGYKKTTQMGAGEIFVLKDGYEIAESIKISSEIIDEVLSTAIGSHFIEPLTVTYETTKIVPIIVEEPHKRLKSKFTLPTINQPRRSSLGRSESMSIHKSPVGRRKSLIKVRISPEDIKSKKLSPTMKMESAYATKEMKPIVREVAEVLHEVIEAVEQGKDHIGFRINLSKRGEVAFNKAQREKQWIKENENRMKEIIEQKRKARAQMLKQAVQISKGEREQLEAQKKSNQLISCC